jgi:hypothetical protein
MPYYEVERYELQASTIRVKADNPVEAVTKVLEGEGTEIDGSLVYIEPADRYGMQAGEYFDEAECRQLFDARALDPDLASFEDAMIPSIRKVEESDDQTDDEDE